MKKIRAVLKLFLLDFKIWATEQIGSWIAALFVTLILVVPLFLIVCLCYLASKFFHFSFENGMLVIIVLALIAAFTMSIYEKYKKYSNEYDRMKNEK